MGRCLAKVASYYHPQRRALEADYDQAVRLPRMEATSHKTKQRNRDVHGLYCGLYTAPTVCMACTLTVGGRRPPKAHVHGVLRLLGLLAHG